MRGNILRVVASLWFTAVAAPAGAYFDGWVERADGALFNSDVGAYCGALNTNIFFSEDEVSVDIHDEAPLDFLADCFKHGELRGTVVAVVASFDGSSWDYERAAERQRSVLAYLMSRGVDRRQLDTWMIANGVAPWEAGRIQFSLVTVPRWAQ